MTVFANKNILPYNKENGKTIISIPSNDKIPKYDTNFSYGLGTWRENPEIAFFATNIDSIIIKNSTNAQILKDKEDIKQYLLKHRSGLYKSAITIEAK